MSRYRDSQLQVGKNYSYLFNLVSNICKSWCLNAYFIPNNIDLIAKKKQIKNDNSGDQRCGVRVQTQTVWSHFQTILYQPAIVSEYLDSVSYDND